MMQQPVLNRVKAQTRHWFIPAVDTKPDIRGEDFLFRLLMFFQKPVSWSRQKVVLNLILWSGLVWGLWQLAAPTMSLFTGIGLLAFSFGDWALLNWLPKVNRSFGPIKPQLMFMLVPRVMVAIFAAGLAGFVQPTWGLIAFFAFQAAGTIAYIWGLGFEPLRLSMTELTVTSPHLPKNEKPIRIMHLSDFHIERLAAREEKVLQFVKQADPDLILITGDYLNASNRCEETAVNQVRQFLPQLQAPYGVYAVLGTPSVDIPYIAPLHFQETNIALLRRDIVEVDLGQDRKVAIMGLDCTHDVKYDSLSFQKMMNVAPTDTTRIFLFHSPELMPEAVKHDLDLYLCGHTHGGQVRIPGFGALFTSAHTGKKYEMGRYDENGTTMYVSRGIGLEGFSMPRIRLFCPPEVTLVTLQGEK